MFVVVAVVQSLAPSATSRITEALLLQQITLLIYSRPKSRRLKVVLSISIAMLYAVGIARPVLMRYYLRQMPCMVKYLLHRILCMGKYRYHQISYLVHEQLFRNLGWLQSCNNGVVVVSKDACAIIILGIILFLIFRYCYSAFTIFFRCLLSLNLEAQVSLLRE